MDETTRMLRIRERRSDPRGIKLAQAAERKRRVAIIALLVTLAVVVVAAAAALITVYLQKQTDGDGADNYGNSFPFNHQTTTRPEIRHGANNNAANSGVGNSGVGSSDTGNNAADTDVAADITTAPARAEGPATIDVVLGNGCFWERQYAYSMLELNDPLFARGMLNITSRVGYAGALGVGDDGTVCYHHTGGDATDVYSTLGHAEGVLVSLDADVAVEQFAVLFQDFLDSFDYDSSKGGSARPDPNDRGAEYRSFLVLPGGIDSEFYRKADELNAALGDKALQLVAGEGGLNDGDDFNTVFVYDSNDGYNFHLGEPYHQFHSNYFGEDYPDWYLDLHDLYAGLDLVTDTGCPSGSHWLRGR